MATVTDPSSALLRRAADVTPGGVHSNVRLAGPRTFIQRARGSRLWDVDGKEYVDHLLGYGTNLFGHAPEFVVDAVSQACRDGILVGGQHPLEVEASEALLGALQWADMVRFVMTGTEAVEAALKLARAHTRRRRVIRFTDQYSGWLNATSASPLHPRTESKPLGGDGSPSDVMVPWNDPEAVNAALEAHPGEIAAILTEPVMLNAGGLLPRPGYLEHLRSMCDEHGALLVFDEMLTGFRLALGGGVEYFGVVPDLATYGKAMAGGFPGAALAGRVEVMERLATVTAHSGTQNANVMTCSAVLATLEHLRTDPPYGRIADYGTSVMRFIEKVGAEVGHDLEVRGVPAAFHVSVADSGEEEIQRTSGVEDANAALASHLLDAGVWVSARGTWFVSDCHGAEDREWVFESFSHAARSWRDAMARTQSVRRSGAQSATRGKASSAP